MYGYLNIKKWSFLLTLYIIEFSLIILFLKAIHKIDNIKIFWFAINDIDHTYYLSHIYFVILILIEIINFQKLHSKVEEVTQIIVSSLTIILLYFSSKNVISGIVIYWCSAGIFNIFKKFLLEKKIMKKLDDEYNINYLKRIYKMIQNEGENYDSCY